jgi:AAA domain
MNKEGYPMSQIVPVSDHQLLKPQTKTVGTSSGDFSASLNRAMGAGNPSSAPAAALGEIQASTFQSIEAPAKETLVSNAGSLLDLMDDYAQNLGNPSKSLKDIAPILDTINERATELLKQSQTLAPQDDSLHRIASEVALTARMEVMKFQRGDYV